MTQSLKDLTADRRPAVAKFNFDKEITIQKGETVLETLRIAFISEVQA